MDVEGPGENRKRPPDRIILYFRVAYVFAASAFFAAQRFLRAATMAALPALLSFLLGLADFGAAAADCPFEAAHRLRCASAIACRPAADIVRRFLFVGSVAAVGPVELPFSICRSSAI